MTNLSVWLYNLLVRVMAGPKGFEPSEEHLFFFSNFFLVVGMGIEAKKVSGFTHTTPLFFR